MIVQIEPHLPVHVLTWAIFGGFLVVYVGYRVVKLISSIPFGSG